MTDPTTPVDARGEAGNSQQPRRSRLFFKFFAFGLGATIGLALIGGVLLWFSFREPPKKPWNSRAIVATYDRVDTEGDANTLVFDYVLENETTADYTLDSRPVLLAQLKDQKSLSRRADEQLLIDLPIFVPSRRRQAARVHLKYTCPEKQGENPSKEQRKAHRAAVAKYVRDELRDLDGFALFDESTHYEIRFPKGW